jgi:hypothetical protein
MEQTRVPLIQDADHEAKGVSIPAEGEPLGRERFYGRESKPKEPNELETI